MEATDINDLRDYPEPVRAEVQMALHMRGILRGVLTNEQRAHARRQRGVSCMKWAVVLVPVAVIVEIFLGGPLGLSDTVRGVVRALLIMAQAGVFIMLWKAADQVNAYRELECVVASIDRHLNQLRSGEAPGCSDKEGQLFLRGGELAGEIGWHHNMKRPLLIAAGAILIAFFVLVRTLS